jgi:CheY-like chemotaxis protein
MIGEPILVMLIEDNIDHAELVIRTLEEHRIANKVRHFLDGQSALDYLFRRGEFSDPASDTQRPHVILLDLRLPYRCVTSEEVKRMQVEKHLVVILTTSGAERMAVLQPANSYLVKPVGFEEFKQLMDDLGFYWLGWNINPGPKIRNMTTPNLIFELVTDTGTVRQRCFPIYEKSTQSSGLALCSARFEDRIELCPSV